MGNLLFKIGSMLLDWMGYGVSALKHDHGHVDGDDSDSDCIDKDDRVIKQVEEMTSYCKPLLFTNFCGQASCKGDTDSNASVKTDHIGNHLRKLDGYLRKLKKINDFSADNEEFLKQLRVCANYRAREAEGAEKCFKRLKRDARRFENIYKERARNNTGTHHSEELTYEEYWGTRQQLLAGKVICDWLSEDDMPPMDPIFGVLLNPTAGRVGPGDSGLVHALLYDNRGEWAHHSAVHDAFGYLLNFHSTGPGYDYMHKSIFDKDNCMAGQISGIAFWKEYVQEVQTKLQVIEAFKNI